MGCRESAPDHPTYDFTDVTIVASSGLGVLSGRTASKSKVSTFRNLRSEGVITGWILTHPNCDGLFVVSYDGNVTLPNVTVNYPATNPISPRIGSRVEIHRPNGNVRTYEFK